MPDSIGDPPAEEPPQPLSKGRDVATVRRELAEWFQVHAAILLPAYEAAVRFIDDPTFPGRLHFLAHAVRDMLNRLPFVHPDARRFSRVQYENALDRIARDWPQQTSTLLTDNVEPAPPADAVPIPAPVFREVNDLVSKHRQRRLRPSTSGQFIQQALHGDPTEIEVSKRIVKALEKEQEWFQSRAHFHDQRAASTTDAELTDHFTRLESLLHSLVGRFFTGAAALDPILERANCGTSEPTNTELEVVSAYLGTSHFARYFFSRLNNPRWIAPLVARGFFDDPPGTVAFAGDTAGFPNWPASQYLFRMASISPAEVRDVFERLSTDNPAILKDMVQAAAEMPADIAVSLVPKICKAHRTTHSYRWWPDGANLCVSLAQQGQPDAALQLTSCLFQIRRQDVVRRDGPRDYMFFDDLQKSIRAIIPQRPNEFLRKLLSWMTIASKAKAKPYYTSPNDGSTHWRPAVEEDDENSQLDVASQLVGCLREAFELAIQGGYLTLQEALALLETHPLLIFRRLRLHLIKAFAERDHGLALGEMMNRDLFDDQSFEREYAALCRKVFPLLNNDQSGVWLSWVDQGPDMSGFDDRVRAGLRREPTPEDHERRSSYWKFERLHWVHADITGKWRHFYDSMLERHGKQDSARLTVTSTDSSADPSLSLNDLFGKTFEQVLDILRSRSPLEHHLSHPLADEPVEVFRQYLARNPSAYATEAHRLIGMPFDYVRVYLDEMKQVVGSDASLDVRPLLELCESVMDQDAAESAAGGDTDARDSLDRWVVSDSVAGFAQRLCQSGTPHQYRDQIWKILQRLTNEAGTASVLDIDHEDARSRDWGLVALNSPLGKALDAVFAFARWVADSVAEEEPGKRILPGGWSAMPEVRQLLQDELGSIGPRAAIVSAMCGHHWFTLYRIDREWLAQRVARICKLTADAADPSYLPSWAAWNSFNLRTPAHIEHYRILRNQFSQAVDQAVDVQAPKRPEHDPFCHLGQHLLILYARGNLTLDDDGAIVRRFLLHAVRPVREHALSFIARAVGHEKEVLSREVASRLMQLWEWYWVEKGETEATSDPETDTFSYWFISGAFDHEWSIRHLEKFVEAVPAPRLDRFDVQRLAEIAAVDLVRSARIIAMLVQGAFAYWRIHSWEESAYVILKAAMGAGEQGRAEAATAIDELGKRGFVRFGELLNIPPGSTSDE